MTSIIKKRRNLHRSLETQKKQNKTLKLQVSQLQALANIGVTTCMIAHEINNLLTPVGNYALLAMNHSDDTALTRKALEKTAKNCQRASEVMSSMLALANGEAKEKKNTSVKKLVNEIFASLCRDFSKDSIVVVEQIPDDLMIFAVPVEIQQVLMNLILNARDAMLGSGGTLTIKGVREEEAVLVEVSDTGSGIDHEVLAEIFEPFFTTKLDGESKSRGSGSGLGLAFCKRVVERYGGTIMVESEKGKGSSFKIRLPQC